MPLDDLFDLIHELRERIDTHGGALRQSEARTRSALIDPLLRTLGWDTSDPAIVIPEYRSGGGLANYALLRNGRPVMMVAVKTLDTPLRVGVGQGIEYCRWKSIAHFSVTDGRRWEVYDIQRQAPISNMRIVSFDLKGQDPTEVAPQALALLALWRPDVQVGRVAVGHSPALVPTPVQPNPPPPSYEWKLLSQLSPQTRSVRPVQVRFPDGSTAPATKWSFILVETVRWLVNADYLTADHCPIRVQNRKRYVVSTTPVHLNGEQFTGSVRVGPLYVEARRNPRQIVHSTRAAVERVGQDPSRFHVGFPLPPPGQ